MGLIAQIYHRAPLFDRDGIQRNATFYLDYGDASEPPPRRGKVIAIRGENLSQDWHVIGRIRVRATATDPWSSWFERLLIPGATSNDTLPSSFNVDFHGDDVEYGVSAWMPAV